MALLEQVAKFVLFRTSSDEADCRVNRSPHTPVSARVSRSIGHSPAVAVSVAMATGVMIGCLLKR